MLVNDERKSLKVIHGNLLQLQKDRSPGINPAQFSTATENKYSFWHIKKITFDVKPDTSRAFANVLAAFRYFPCRLAWILSSQGKLVFHIGIRALKNGQNSYGQMLADAFRGAFRGSELVEEEEVNLDRRFTTLGVCSCILGIPSQNAPNEGQPVIAAIDRVVHSLGNRPFTIAIIWENVPALNLSEQKKDLEGIYRDFLPWGKSSHNRSESETKHHSKDSPDSNGQSTTQSFEVCDKELLGWQKALDDELLPRSKIGIGEGMFNTAIYLAAENIDSLALLENIYTGVFQGDRCACAPLYALPLSERQDVGKLIREFRIYNSIPVNSPYISLLSRPFSKGMTSLSTWLTGQELSTLARFPHEDVPGLEVSPRVGFGLQIPEVLEREAIELGVLLKDGIPQPHLPVRLKRDDLERHIFISGVTGSGKTTTCHRILSECARNNGFMVLEPAKTEYRNLLSDPAMRGLLIFTPGNEKVTPFRLNPFEFLPSENISSHIDLLKASFMASFEMEAAIPQLMEQAMYVLYDRFGWNIVDNNNRFLKNREEAWEDIHGHLFPTISDYIEVVVDVAKSMGFGERLQDEYVGSLRARLESLTVGSKGLMLNTRRSIDFDWLLDQKVVIELEELKSGEDKAFIMALIIGRLVEALKARYRKDAKSGKNFQHILLIEEAHRLLTNPDPGSSKGRRLSVEMFADLLAEVRKYHESLIIVDQIPSKLAPEILKNTSTKIVHTLFAHDDKQALGNAMALSKEQTEYIARLKVGQTLVISRDWPKAAHVAINKTGDLASVGEDKILANGRLFWESHSAILCPDISKKAASIPTLKKLQRMDTLAHELPKYLPRDVSETEKARWDEFFSLVKHDVGETAELFLTSAIAGLLLRQALHGNIKDTYMDLKRDSYRRAKQIVDWDMKALRSFLTQFNWGY